MEPLPNQSDAAPGADSNPLEEAPAPQAGQVFSPGQAARAAASAAPTAPQPITPSLPPQPSPAIAPPPPEPSRPLGVAGPSPADIYPTPGVQPVPPAPANRSFFRRFHLKLALLVLAVLVVLGGGAAAAYFGYYVPNQPQNILAKGLENTLAAHSETTTGNLSFDTGSISSQISYTAKIDSDDHAVDVNLTPTVSGVSIPVELLTANGNLYFKLGDLSTAEGLLNQFGLAGGQNLQPLITKVNKAVENQWIEVDNTLIREAKLGCLTNYPAPLSQSDIQALQNAYRQDSFATISSHSDDTVNGAAAIKYQMIINGSKSNKFNFDSVKYFKDLDACLNSLGGSGGSSVTDQDLSGQLQNNQNTPFTLWVDKKTKRVVKYSIQTTAQDKSQNGFDGALSGTINYNLVKVTAPANAKPVLNLINDLGLGDLTSLFAGSSIPSGSASGNSPQTNSGESTAAKDIERKTDINAIQGQIEASDAANGYYPTLAQINDSNWRAQNFQGFDSAALKDPDGTAASLASKPGKDVYAYQPAPASCNNTSVQCTSYTLTATLSDGSTYVKQALE